MVEVGPKEDRESTSSTLNSSTEPDPLTSAENKEPSPDHRREALTADDTTSNTPRKSRWFHDRNGRPNSSGFQHDRSGDGEEENHPALHLRQVVSEDGGRGVADDARMSLG